MIYGQFNEGKIRNNRLMTIIFTINILSKDMNHTTFRPVIGLFTRTKENSYYFSDMAKCCCLPRCVVVLIKLISSVRFASRFAICKQFLFFLQMPFETRVSR